MTSIPDTPRAERLYAVTARRLDAAVAEVARLRKALADPGEHFPARHPGRGRAVLACRCGAMLDAADIVRITPARAGFAHETTTVIFPVGCRGCAAKAAGRSTPRTRPARPVPPAWRA